MSFRQYENSKRSKKVNRKEAIELNSHINFSKEKKKGNARKDMTPVVCVYCKKKFTLPFKPRHPEVYCEKCFKEQKRIP
jgi:CxxC-x17-CxxC domain-containing protein